MPDETDAKIITSVASQEETTITKWSRDPETQRIEKDKGDQADSNSPGADSRCPPQGVDEDGILPPSEDLLRTRTAMEEVLRAWEKEPIALRSDAGRLVRMFDGIREDRGELVRILADNKAEIARRMALAPDDSHVEYPTEIDPEYAAREAARMKDFEQTFGTHFARALEETFGHSPEEMGVRVPTVERLIDFPITHEERANPVPDKVRIRRGVIPFSGEFNSSGEPKRVTSEQPSSDRDENVNLEEVQQTGSGCLEERTLAKYAELIVDHSKKTVNEPS